VKRGLFLEELIKDLRISLRGLLRAPVMTMTIMATVGLGIGATTAIFGAIDSWLRIYNGERPHDSLGRVPPLTFLPRPSSAGQSLFALST
jgi:hypothetical protein